MDLGNSTLERGKSRSGDLHVMILGIRADADRADYFVIHNDRKRSLHFDETTRSRGRDATTVDSILEILARLLEQRRGPRLARRKLHSGEYTGVIHPLNQGRPSAVLHHAHAAGPIFPSPPPPHPPP